MELVITLFVIGLILIIVEMLIIPGFGIPGILGLLSVLGSITYSFYEFGKTIGLYTLGGEILVTSIIIWLVLRSDTWKKITLKETITEKLKQETTELNIGDNGVTISRLNPSGKARFGNTDAEVISQEGLIQPSTPITIAEIDHSKIIVTKSK